MKNNKLQIFKITFLCSFLISLQTFGEVQLARIFSDHMVLQRGMQVPVWGTANPMEVITIEIDGISVNTRASKEGKWKAYLPEFEAGGPYEMVVKGSNELSLSDVLFGDVWVASGQSNMEWTLENSNDAENEVKQAKYPSIRMFYVKKRVGSQPKEDLDDGQWDLCTPDVAKSFSAVAYFFGRELHKDLNVPIGLINCNWGGTPAEAWTSEEMLMTLPDFKEKLLATSKEPDWESDLLPNQERGEERSRLIRESYNGIEAGVLKSGYTANDWPSIVTPNPEEQKEGIVWFRKLIEVPKEFKGKSLKLQLGRIDNIATVYFNDFELGTTRSPNYIEYSIPDKEVKSGKNVITIRALNSWSNKVSFTGPESMMKLLAPNGAVLEDLSGPWKVNTGLEPELPKVIKYSHYPSSLYNGMLKPLVPYGIKGAIWYQGESNAGRAYQYRVLFQSMIQDWRVQWGQGYFPFFFVQLANYMDTPTEPMESDWAELREAQLMALRLPNTGMAVTMDIGDQFDIHPRNKQDVGHRLALAAKKVAYGMDLVHSGPIYTSMEVNGSEIELAFDHVGRGLVANGGSLQGFQIAGEDKKFYWAEAKIVGGEVFVSSEKVKAPVAVRYGWGSNMDCNLFNKDGLPASPFRTDDWDGVTKGRK